MSISDGEASKHEAIVSLKPGAEFNLIGDTLEWLDKSQTAPTESEIAAERTRLDTEYANKKYKRDRKAEYPNYGEQLDYIYHHGTTKWKSDLIKPIKDKYPKP